MNLLYGGAYLKRFAPVVACIRERTVLELCFGDTVIAGWCRAHHVKWEGLDIHEKFVNCARKRGFSAHAADLKQTEKLPSAELCIITGSLYHFHGNESRMFRLMLAAAPRVIISEPVRNWPPHESRTGKLLRKWLAGKNDPGYRYDRKSFNEMLREQSKKLEFKYQITASFKKDLIAIIEK